MNFYYICAFFMLILYVQAQTIQKLFLNQSVSLLNSGRDGYLIATLVTGEDTTICNYKFGDAEANVACLTLGYPAQGISMVGPKVSRSGPVLIGDIACVGTETNLNLCISSGRKVFGSPCSSHDLDAYVYCLQDKVAPQINTNVASIKCNSTNGPYKFIPLAGMVNTGFLTYNGNYVCNSNFAITSPDAIPLCQKFCNGVSDSQPTIGKPGVPTGATFVILSAPSYASSVLVPCPSAVLALQCAPEPVFIEASPNITCNTQNITAAWNTGLTPPINPSLIGLASSCPNTSYQISSNATYAALITINFLNCSAFLSGNSTHISYAYVVIRSYNTTDITSTAPRNLTIACNFPKADIVNQSLSVKGQNPVYLNSSTILPVEMVFYADQSYKTLMELNTDKFYTVYDTSLVYVRVSLLSNVSTLSLGLVNCKIATVNIMENTNSSNSLNLITSSCPSTNTAYSVSIYPLSRRDMGFRFKPYVIGGNNVIYVLCETTKCFMDSQDINCLRCQSSSRKKRSVLDTEVVVHGPIIIKN